MNNWKCRKCQKLDENGMYYDAIGWFCDKHFQELDKIIDNFIESDEK